MVWSQLILAGIVRGGVAGLVVTQWLREARPATRRMDVTGGMLFDGERWVQLFEGRLDAVDAMARLAAGHADLGLDPACSHRSGALQRDCAYWACGYVEPLELVRVLSVFEAPGPDATSVFAAVLASSDAS